MIDASNTVVMPGVIDAHRHMLEGILRNIGTDVPLGGDASYLAYTLNAMAPVLAWMWDQSRTVVMPAWMA